MKRERGTEEERQKILNALMKDPDFRRDIIESKRDEENKEKDQIKSVFMSPWWILFWLTFLIISVSMGSR